MKTGVRVYTAIIVYLVDEHTAQIEGFHFSLLKGLFQPGRLAQAPEDRVQACCTLVSAFQITLLCFCRGFVFGIFQRGAND